MADKAAFQVIVLVSHFLPGSQLFLLPETIVSARCGLPSNWALVIAVDCLALPNLPIFSAVSDSRMKHRANSY